MTNEARIEDTLRVLDDYDFRLPGECISQRPAKRREQARLMVIDRATGAVVESSHAHRVSALPEWLRPGDLLVVNVTRVLPARLVGHKRTGGIAEALLLGPVRDGTGASVHYRALVKCGGRLRQGVEFEFVAEGARPSRLQATISAVHERGEVTLRFAEGTDPYAHGRAPLPPYIQRSGEAAQENDLEVDLERYQTVYASEPGAVAAPTAGLHLTRALLDRLRSEGVEIAEVVLHVGVGTFRPLEPEAFESGRLHAEHFVLPEATAAAIERTRQRRGRVVAVGTTTTRVLESRANPAHGVEAGEGETDLFMRPGGPPFRVVDALLTNFHLPRSSLLLLVAAFMGRAPLLAAYEKAIQEGFRFFSYGDAMLICSGAEAERHG